jgi:hypothetical protein
MTYVCDLRENSYNNVIEINNRLFIEGQRYTVTNLAPVALSFGPTNFPLATSAAGGTNASQLMLARTYVRGSLGLYPQLGTAGMFDSTKIACGQDVTVGFVYSPNNNRYYGAAGTNTSGKASSFDANFRPLNLDSITLNTMSVVNTGTVPITLFCPLSNGRWIYTSTQSAIATTGYSTSATTMVVNSLSDAGVVGTPVNVNSCVPAIPYIGSTFAVFLAVPWFNSTSPNVQTIYANRTTGVISAASIWIPGATATVAASGCFPSNAIEVSSSEAYFYHPIVTSTGMTVYIGTVSGLNSTPSISAWNAADSTLALDTSEMTFPATLPTTPRQVRAFVHEDAGTRYLNVYIFEPGVTNTVSTSFMSLYLWRLESKTTATFLQKLSLGDGGRVRAILPTNNTQKRIAVVYDDKVAIYTWNPLSNWTVQSVTDIATQDVAVDSTERVWVTTRDGTYQLAGGSAQQLHVIENVGAAATISAEFEEAEYQFSGTAIDSNIVVNAFDSAGNRVAISVTIERISTNFSFGGAPSTIVTTSTTGDTLVPISVFSTGLLNCRVAPTA